MAAPTFVEGPIARVEGTLNASDLRLDLSAATTPQPASLSMTFNASNGRLSLPPGSVTGHLTLNASTLEVVPAADAGSKASGWSQRWRLTTSAVLTA